MVLKMHNCKKRKTNAVDLAVAALDGNPNPLDADMTAVDLHPGSLDLPQETYRAVSSKPRCCCRVVNVCVECGSSLCDECVGLPGTMTAIYKPPCIAV